MMKCGHEANAKNSKTGASSCAICIGIHPGAEEVLQIKLVFEGRMAKCSCGNTKPSIDHESLAFFEFKGENSCHATEVCICSYSKEAHTKKMTGELHFSSAAHVCDEFTPRGAAEFDTYYCGCAGWD